jgi:hypothetical protein
LARTSTSALPTASLLGLSTTDLGNVTARVLRVGNTTAANNVNVSAAFTFASAKVPTLAIRGAGDITESGSGAISVTSLGLLAGGIITFGGGNGVTGNLALSATGATVTFSQSSGAYTPAAVDGITANFGVPSSVSVSQVPTATPQDAFMAVTFNPPPVVTLKDTYGNNLGSANANKSAYKVTAALASSTNTSGTMALSGTTSLVATNGTATFSDLKVTGGTGTATLSFTVSLASDVAATAILPSSTTGTYNVQAGDPSNLNVSVAAAGGRSGLAFTTQPTVQIRDVGNNLVQTSPGNSLVVTATLSSGNGTLIGTTTATAVNSVATFSNLGITGSTGNSYTITYSVTYNSTVISTQQSSISITYGDAAKLAITTQAAGFVNRTDFTTQPVVEIRDSADNKVANSTANVTISIDSGTLTGTNKTVAAINGVATFAGIGKTGTIGSKTITFTSGSLATDSQTFTLTYGAATQVTLTAPSTLVNDTVMSTQPVATIKDADGNTVTSGSDSTQTVTLTSTNATISGTTSMAAVGGVADFNGKGVKLRGLIGARNLTATISSPSTITGTASVTITYGTANKVVLTTPAAGFVNRTDFTTQPVVQIQDVSGNVVANATDNVTISIDSGTLTGSNKTVAAVNGVATFAGIGKTGTIGSKTITFTSGSLATDSQTFTLTHGAAAQVAVTLPSSVSSGFALSAQPIATIQDADGNTVTSGAQSTQTVTLSSPDSTISGTVSMAAVAGVANFTGKGVTLSGTAGSRTITAAIASPSAITGSAFITVLPGIAYSLGITAPATATVGVNFSSDVVVTIYDQWNNVVTVGGDSYATISLAATGLTGTISKAATNGVATFSGLQLNTTAGVNIINVSMSGRAVTTSTTVTLSVGAADSLRSEQSIGATTQNRVNFASQPKIAVIDKGGNSVSVNGVNITVAASGSGTAIFGTTTATTVNGVATFTNLQPRGTKYATSAQAYVLTFTPDNGLTAITQSTNLTTGPVADLYVWMPTTAQTNGVTFTGDLFVNLMDLDGNTMLGDTTTTVTVSSSTATLSATGNLTQKEKVGFDYASFNGLGLKAAGPAGSHTLTFTAVTSDSRTFSVNKTFTLAVGAAAQLGIAIAADTAAAGAVFGTQPVIEIQDVGGNRVTNATDTIVASVDAGTLNGTKSIATTTGRVAYSGLSIDGAAGTRTLTYTSTNYGSVNQTISLGAGAPAKVVLTQQVAGFVNRTDFTTQPIAQIQDASGNLVTTATDNVTISLSGATLTGTDIGVATKTVAAIGGIATFSGLGKYGPVGSVTLTAASGSLTSATQTFSLTFGAAYQVSLTAPATAASGAALSAQPVATIQDRDGNTVTTATQTVTLSSPDSTISGTTSMAAVGGIANFSGKGVTLTGATGNKTLTATVSGLGFTNSAFVSLGAGAAHHLTLVTPAAGFVNRTDFTTQPVVEVRDAQDNVVTSASTVTVGISSGTLTGNLTVATVNGVATFVGLGKTGAVGSKTLTFSSGALTVATQTFILTHGATTQIGITNSVAPASSLTYYPSGPQTSVTEASITSGGWTQCWSGLYNGSANLNTVWASCNGSYLMLAGGPVSSTTFDVVAAAPAADVKFDTGTTNTAHNANGTGWYYSSSYSMGFAGLGDPLSRNSCDTSTVNSAKRLCWHTSGGSISGGYRSGANMGLNGSTTYRRVIYMSNNAPGTASVTNAVPFVSQPVLALKDADGNVCTTDNQSVTASMTSGLTGIQTVAAVNGIVTFSGLTYTGAVGTQQITYALAATPSVNSSETFTVVAGAANKLALTTPAAGFVNRAAFTTQPVVTVQDVSGNPVLDSTAAVTVSIDSGTLTGTATVNAVGGTATFSGLGKTGLVGSKTLTFSSGSLATTTQTFTLTHGVAAAVTLVAPSTLANNNVFATL